MAGARTFVLIAGAWHGAWCWQKITPILEAAGHRVLAPELPSMGADTTDPASITLDGWAQFVAECLRAQPEPVVLVGHSRAGIILSQVAELVPERILRLVYLAAYLLPNGANLAAEARRDRESLVPANMIPARGGVTCTLREEVIRAAFYGMCSEQDYLWALDQLSPEPLKPLVTALKLTGSRFGSVPRVYIECLQDRTISLAAQRDMQAALACDPVLTLDSDHSPFFSRPAELARMLSSI